MSEKTQDFINKCQMYFRTKPCRDMKLQPSLQQIYEQHNEPEDIHEIDLVDELPTSKYYTHIVTATDDFSCYRFAIPICRPDTASKVKALLTTFTQHAYVSQHILTDQGSAVTSKPLTELMDKAGIKIAHAIQTHAQRYQFFLMFGISLTPSQHLSQNFSIVSELDKNTEHKYDVQTDGVIAV